MKDATNFNIVTAPGGVDSTETGNSQSNEMTLNELNKKHLQIIEATREGIWLIDEHGRTTFVNKKMCEILKYAREEILGKDFFYFMDDAGKKWADHSIEKRKKGIAENIDVRYITKTGENIWTNIVAIPLFDKEGKYTGSIALVADITEKLLLQEQLVEEKKNKYKEINQAIIDAREKERSYIGVELHDNVSQLLAAANLYLGYSLLKPDHTPYILKSQQYLTVAIAELRRFSHFLVDLTDNKPINLISSLKELISDIGFVKATKIDFIADTFREEESQPELKLVIYRIVQEQLNNIVKHAKATEVTVTLQQESSHVIVTIDDNGIGFDTSAKCKGIGLKNIKNRAEICDGVVQISSSPGKGCKMVITFRSPKKKRS